MINLTFIAKMSMSSTYLTFYHSELNKRWAHDRLHVKYILWSGDTSVEHTRADFRAVLRAMWFITYRSNKFNVFIRSRFMCGFVQNEFPSQSAPAEIYWRIIFIIHHYWMMVTYQNQYIVLEIWFFLTSILYFHLSIFYILV